MPDIELAGNRYQYTLNKSHRRSISLRVNETGQIEVKAPHLMPGFLIDQFIKSKAEWIVKHMHKVEKILKNTSFRNFQNNTLLYFFDRRLILSITSSEKAVRPRIYAINDTLQVIVPSQLPEHTKENAIREEIHRWYHNHVLEALAPKVEKYAIKMGVSYETIRVKDVSSHWGSCSINKNLNFNYRLGMIPPELADYVIVHELCHLREMNHSAAFWRLVEEVLPDYKELRTRLKKDYAFMD